MNTIVIKYDVYSNVEYKYADLYEKVVLLSTRIDVPEAKNVVYIHFDSPINLSIISSSFYNRGFLHRVNLI